ncbi:16S rRNA (guanine(527)-N(7))-methyltransferase RsmG [Roseovarius sp. D0-M9]|uniref:16S rRNA (guanine(527)-N(7))-methyltransferase RsmG n=1 Tax=Roseovarius sp. D0-M9 TaxID=3127117 RepID=UPI00300FB01A
MSEFAPDVSRETIERLRAFQAVVSKWTPKINLVSKDSVPHLWERHILDSVQLVRAAPKRVTHWLDLGSGGGFPGVVAAIFAMDARDERRVTLVESDARKCAFLRTALRETGAQAKVLNERIEDVPPQGADVVSARALADLSALLGYADIHLGAGGVALFAKGARWREEADSARSQWNFNLEAVKSEFAAEAAILKITGVSRV